MFPGLDPPKVGQKRTLPDAVVLAPFSPARFWARFLAWMKLL